MVQEFAAKLSVVTSGEVTHLVIFNNDQPEAVLLGVETYQAVLDELEDLRAERLAIERLSALDEKELVDLNLLEARFR